MQQIAVRLSAEMLDEIDAINDARRAGGGRTAIIRELLWESIDRRRKASK